MVGFSLFSPLWGPSRISRISKFSRISIEKRIFLKRPLFQKTPFSDAEFPLLTFELFRCTLQGKRILGYRCHDNVMVVLELFGGMLQCPASVLGLISHFPARLQNPKKLLRHFLRNIRAATLQKCGAEVIFFSVFLCQRCREIWREIFFATVLRFPGFGCARENFTNMSRQKQCAKRKISGKFHSAGAHRWEISSQGKKYRLERTSQQQGLFRLGFGKRSVLDRHRANTEKSSLINEEKGLPH